MRKIARFAAETKPRLVASRRNSAPWPLLRLLPAPLAQLPDDVRAGLGRALDQGLIRYALDEVTGAAVVTRAGGR